MLEVIHIPLSCTLGVFDDFPLGVFSKFDFFMGLLSCLLVCFVGRFVVCLGILIDLVVYINTLFGPVCVSIPLLGWELLGRIRGIS